MKMIPVTVVIPVLNEEANLPTCLSKVRSFRQVLVVDSGSTDRTVEIAKEAGATILQFQWNGHFPKKRNWVLRNHQFETNWVLFLDADEEVTPEFESEVLNAIKNQKWSGFWIRYDNFFMGRRLRFGVPQRKLALFMVGRGAYERIEENGWSDLDMEVHEHPIINGRVGQIRSAVLHHNSKTLHSFIQRHNDYSDWEARRYMELRRTTRTDLTARQRFKYSLVASRFFPLAYFLFAYIVRGGFLDGRSGLDYAIFKSTYFHQISLKIAELRKTATPEWT